MNEIIKKLNIVVLAFVPADSESSPSHLGFLKLNTSLKNNFIVDINTLLISHKEDDSKVNVKLEVLTKNDTGEVEWELFRKFDEFIFTDKNQLSEIFNELNDNFPAQDTVLLIVGHAFGFGFFKPQEIKNDTIGSSISPNLNLFDTSSDFNFVSRLEDGESKIMKKLSTIDKSDVTSGHIMDMLTVRELKSAIQSGGFKKNNCKELKMFVMAACNMMTIDTIYSLKDQTDYIVGAQTSMHWLGYDYDNLMNYFKTSVLTSIDYKVAGNILVNTYKGGFDQEKMKFYEKSKIALIDTKYLTRLLEIINEIVMKLLKSKNRISAFKSLADSENSSIDTSNTWDNLEKGFDYNYNYHFFDMHQIIILKILKESEIDLRLKLDLIIKNLVINKSFTNDPFTKDLSGISIIIPQKSDVINLSMAEYFFTLTGKDAGKFYYDSLWYDLLNIVKKHNRF